MLPAKVDVLVVGAGVSGLVAATALHGLGYTLGVLEARTRVGGRLLSTPGGADLGGSWSWSHDANVHALTQRLGASAVSAGGAWASCHIRNMCMLYSCATHSRLSRMCLLARHARVLLHGRSCDTRQGRG